MRADEHRQLTCVWYMLVFTIGIYTVPLVFIIRADINLPIVPKHTRNILYVNVFIILSVS